MSKLTEIENALLRIDPTAFQQFGDEYLYFAEPGFPDIQRSGTEKGKLKPVKGHPDSYYRTAGGKYVFIEHTTLEPDPSGNALLRKIKKDLLDCWSEEQTGVPHEQIERIVYCCNSNLSPKLELELESFVQKEGIPFAIGDIKSLDTLSNDVVNRFPWLAKKLGLTIDTEQLLPIRTFVREYQSSPFATPLTLPLVGRETELDALREAINKSSITLVTGISGAGKTRLVLAALEQAQQTGSTVYYVSDKYRPIFDDLRSYLIDTRPYILFMDDGNYRIPFLKELLILLREERTHSLHLVITVRNSALAAVQEQCWDYATYTITIEKLEDDDIRSILQGQPFHLTHRFAIDHILSIANGNPRLAVMAAQVAVEGNSMEGVLDVSALYHRYFDRIIDGAALENSTHLRVMGLLAFFRTIHLENTAFCNHLFKLFGLDARVVYTICQQGLQMELLDADSSLTSFRIGEQTLAAYFFYRTCIEAPLIDMGVLFREYFSSHTDRFNDMILGAYNMFGQQKVMDKLRPAMAAYWTSIKSDEPLAIKYLDAFWYGQTDVLLHYVERKIGQIAFPEQISFDYSTEITPNQPGFGDPWLGLLANGYFYDFLELADFLELSLDYIRKVPWEYPRFFANLQHAFSLQQEDEQLNFHRQQVLVNILKAQGTEEEMPVRTLLKLAPTLLRTSGQFSILSRTRETMHIHRVQYGLSEELQTLRESIWQHIFELPATYNNCTRAFFEDYQKSIIEADSTILAYDNPKLLHLFEQVLLVDSFADCCVVQQWIRTLSRQDISDPAIDAAKNHFSNPTYELYQRLHTDRLEGVDRFELSHDIPVFEHLKEQEIRAACSFPNIETFKAFFESYRVIREWEEKRQENFVGPALDIALEEAIKRGELGLSAVRIIIDAGNPTAYIPYRPIQWMVQQQAWETYDRLYQLVKSENFTDQPRCIEQLIYHLPSNRLTPIYIDDLVNAYGQPGWKGYAVSDWKRLLEFEPSSVSQILSAIKVSNTNKIGTIQLLADLVGELTESWNGDWTVLKETYLQQAQLFRPFDANYWALTKIVAQQPEFLAEYMESSTADWLSARDHRGLGIIWKVPTAEQAMRGTFDYGLTEDRLSRTRNVYPHLFTRIPEQEEERAYSFLCCYAHDYSENEAKINVVLNCVREGLPQRWESFVLYLLSIQQDPAFFAKLQWTQDSYLLKGNTIVEDVKAEEYRMVLKIIEKAPGKRHRYAEHRAYLQQKIDELEKQAAYRRKVRFLYGDR